MQIITTVTQKGQVTLPKILRDAVGIKEYDKVVIEAGKNHLLVKPTKDILDYAGTIIPQKNKNKSVLDARKALEKSYQRV